ncbi:hypothetical protein GNI_078230 [Gregarina niphandrodes]|uniref:Uncharacterized protein n=1 Tax=Gregarina niphandrodes TaxID=110365 RepID=A0A023B6M7_GRENI|nr:hypothetical protein GNI_078230 [Gregarina niphandrodes]EZG66629.1 hypothetical protein GNI_078230 [Gregarina niphandrodes]|eukprot:XP_011130558.1 hypothetical protein GNI_078230 [Gregarina niphandrodes]
MSISLHDGVPVSAWKGLHRYYKELGLKCYDVEWPPAAKRLNYGVIARVQKCPRSQDLLRLKTAALDVPFFGQGLNDFEQSAPLGTVKGYWSCHGFSQNAEQLEQGHYDHVLQEMGNGIVDRGAVDRELEELRPLFSHVVVVSSTEGYVDRELKRIMIFNEIANSQAAEFYVLESLLRAGWWKVGTKDKSRESARFVSIPLSDLWTFPGACIKVIEKLVVDEKVGTQHFDLVSKPVKHNMTAKCTCSKYLEHPAARSYLVFPCQRIKQYLQDNPTLERPDTDMTLHLYNLKDRYIKLYLEKMTHQ